MARLRSDRKDLPILPSTPAPTIDLEAMMANAVRKANAEVPERIKRMTPAQCSAEARRLLRERPEFPAAKTWAHKILSRVADGEYVPMIAEQKAREAVYGERLREPGDDDEELAA